MNVRTRHIGAKPVPQWGVRFPLLHISLTLILACQTLTACTGGAALGKTPELPVQSSLLQGLGDTRYQQHSSAILGRDFHLFVRLPETYADEPEAHYPVIYLLDGGNTFPMLAAFHHYLRLGEETPAAVLVGIAYGSEYYRGGNMRQTDFTAPAADGDFWGGAAAFQQVLQREILPLIESRFRADPERRILFGSSLGGQFVLFSALTRPQLFWGHIASNPALHRNLDYFMEWRGPGQGHGSLSHLFVSSGSLEVEQFRAPTLQWMQAWNARAQLPWRLETRTLEGQTHYSAAPEALRQGLDWLFTR